MKEIFIDEEEMAKYLLKALVELGYAPSEDEVDDIVTLVFDYLDELEEE